MAINTECAIGCDPEVFATDSSGNFISLIGKIGGSKQSPRKASIGWVQEDNVAAEYNIRPAKTENTFVDRNKKMLHYLKNSMKKHELDIAIRPSAAFNPEQLIHPQARAIGCDPDYNAYTGMRNLPATSLAESNIRTAAGHVHISWPFPDSFPMGRINAVYYADLFIGLPMLFIDTDITRRKFYGKAGTYRPKPYGIEYRTPSNAWLLSEERMRWVFRQAMKVAQESFEVYRFGEGLWGTVRRCIDETDAAAAKQICTKYGIHIPV